MFTYDDWISEVVGVCELIVSKDALYRTWVLHDYSITSIHYYDELFQQLIGDLRLDENIKHFKSKLDQHRALDSVAGFATALHYLDEQIESRAELRDPAVLLISPEWQLLKEAAAKVLVV